MLRSTHEPSCSLIKSLCVKPAYAYTANLAHSSNGCYHVREPSMANITVLHRPSPSITVHYRPSPSIAVHHRPSPSTLYANATHNHEVNDVYHMQKSITLSDMRAEVQKLLPATCKIVYDSSTTHQNDRSALKSADTVSLGSHAFGAPFLQKHMRARNTREIHKSKWPRATSTEVFCLSPCLFPSISRFCVCAQIKAHE